MHDGDIEYIESFVPDPDALFHHLLTHIPWSQPRGRFGPVPRLVAWFGDTAYRYSGITHEPQPWIEPLVSLKSKLDAHCNHAFNTVLLNRYRTGSDSMGWHADDERELGTNPIIASVSLGATRKFKLRYNETREVIDYNLAHGSLLVMRGETQHHWQHCLPKTKRPVGERINLTFRWTAARLSERPADPPRPQTTPA